jgi:hypothetical protein
MRAIALSTLCLSFAPRPTRSRPLGCQAATTMVFLRIGNDLVQTASLLLIQVPPLSLVLLGVLSSTLSRISARIYWWAGGPEAVRMNAPRIGSSFAVGEACAQYVIVPSCMCVRRIPGTLLFLVRPLVASFLYIGDLLSHLSIHA